MTPEQKRKHLSSYYWQKMSKHRIEFDGGKCQGFRCHRTQNLDVHHISYENHGTEDEFNDLITLCRSCHKKEHARLNKLSDKQLTLFEFLEKQPSTVLQAASQQKKKQIPSRAYALYKRKLMIAASHLNQTANNIIR